ncbi:MAG: RsmB/NOP family class I SAM-dependent RNA methyltransferase [Promethearchaeota archaeon]
MPDSDSPPTTWDPDKFVLPGDLGELLERTFGNRRDLRSFEAAVARPSGHYSLRVVPWNLSEGLEKFLGELRRADPGVAAHPNYPDVVLLPVRGPREVPLEGKVVRVLDGAAESVVLGAHLYAPGLDRSRLPRLRAGDPVSLVATRSNVLVAAGKALLDGSQLAGVRRGPVVANEVSTFRVLSFRESGFYARGQLVDQSLPAHVAGVVAAQACDGPDARVADLCAAPGGKTTALAQEFRHRFGEFPRVVAADRSRNRLARMAGELERLRVGGVELRRGLVEKLAGDEPAFREAFDVVVLDPPCSALGGRPRLWVRVGAADVESASRNQRRLLLHADALVKPGGALVYSVCTVPVEECEEAVDYLLGQRPYEVEDAGEPVGGPGLMGDAQLLSKSDLWKFRRFLPGREDEEGFFLALLRKRG